VNASGDVKLTWIPPSDPQNNYFGFEVYFATARNGPYTQAFSGPAAITTTSFVHTTTISVAQSVFYYVRSLFGTNGVTKSSSSDTLRSLFLNINTSVSETYRLNYNRLREPTLPSTASSFKIEREYPSGFWNDLATTSQILYDDTLNICNRERIRINYIVTIPDNSGCISKSNIQGGEYGDKHNPYMLVVDSISVLPNGNTVIAWKIPIDKDVVNYEIQQEKQGLNTPIDTLTGINTISYTLSNTLANTGTVGLYVKPIDSCGGGGIVDYTPATMHLIATYNYCKFETELQWTPYKWFSKNNIPSEELLEYRIFMSTNGGVTFSLLGTTSSTNFLHQNVETEKNTVYFIRVVNKRQTMTASSNRAGFYAGKVPAPEFVYIKTATVVKKTEIDVWVYVDPKKGFKGIEVERSEDGLSYTLVDFIPYKSGANYKLIDENVETTQRDYYYRATIIDSCGNRRLISNVAKTILLNVDADEEDVFIKHLTWTPYLGFDGGVKNYLIYRIVNDVNETELVGKTDSATYYFEDNIEFAAPLGARVEYQVVAEERTGNIYQILEKSRSNYRPAYMEGRIYVPNAFVPAGVNKTWKPVTHFIDVREYNVTVFNRWGAVVFQTNNNTDEWDGANCPPGTYVYLISHKNSRGEYQNTKGTITLIR